MQRIIQPEILDSLPPDHPDALHNRRDIGRINVIMGAYSWFAAKLPGLVTPGEGVLELGAGDGALGGSLARAGLRIDGLDRCPRPSVWPKEAGWHRDDLRAFSGYADYPVVIGNLILHQFTPEELGEVGRTLNRTARLIVVNEPARRRRFQCLMRLLAPLIGANYVSRHDARVSIAAGFLGDELPHALGLDEKIWSWRCTTTLRSAYRMIAQRR